MENIAGSVKNWPSILRCYLGGVRGTKQRCWRVGGRLERTETNTHFEKVDCFS